MAGASSVPDVDECQDPLQCPGQECVNSEGSYICIPCRVGHTMKNRKCSGETATPSLPI